MSQSSSPSPASRQLELTLARREPAVETVTPEPILRRSPRAKRLQIKVSPWKGIEVILPQRCSQRTADRFVDEHREWMAKAWRKLLQDYPEAGQWELPQSIELPLLERQWQVQLDPLASRFRAGRNHIVLAGNPSPTEHAVRLQQWVRLQAGKALPKRLQPWIEQTGLQPSKISIRGQATRWGSCSSQGTLSLNFRLMFLAPELVDCLLLHELCHLVHMNHGKRFHALMQKHMPDARERDRALGEAWRDVPAWAQVK
jgi:hypothetical protein